jgi:hypothetical protein
VTDSGVECSRPKIISSTWWTDKFSSLTPTIPRP